MRIFISYRREDTRGYAGRLYDRLSQHFGSDNVFMDIDTIGPGQDFVKVLEGAVGKSNAVIVLIGQKWLSITDEGGSRRLDNPNDFVRTEVASSLEKDVLVIPVLVEDARVPRAAQLPEPLKALSRRQGMEISDDRFHHDVDRLISAIEKSVSPDDAWDAPESGERLEALYTEGLSAYWLGEWDRAVERFQAIVKIDPNYEQAAEKLAAAQLSLKVRELNQAGDRAVQDGDWKGAITAFEELVSLDPEFEGASAKLESARLQKRVSDLYAEAKRLHAAREWVAVTHVIGQIRTIRPEFEDPDNLEPSAKAEITAAENEARLKGLYASAIRQLDRGALHEARALLQEVLEIDPQYGQSEQLLERVNARLAPEGALEAGEAAAAGEGVKAPSPLPPSGEPAGPDPLGASGGLARTAPVPGELDGDVPPESGRPGSSALVAILLHLTTGAGLIYLRAATKRKWIYPVALLAMLVGYALGVLNVDANYLGGDLISDSVAKSVIYLGLAVYLVGYVEVARRVTAEPAQATVGPGGEVPSPSPPRGERAGFDLKGTSDTLEQPAPEGGESGEAHPTKIGRPDFSALVALVLQLTTGAGLIYLHSASKRKWIYPLAFLAMIVGYMLGYADIDAQNLGFDILSDRYARSVLYLGFAVYSAGYVEILSRVTTKPAQAV